MSAPSPPYLLYTIYVGTFATQKPPSCIEPSIAVCAVYIDIAALRSFFMQKKVYLCKMRRYFMCLRLCIWQLRKIFVCGPPYRICMRPVSETSPYTVTHLANPTKMCYNYYINKTIKKRVSSGD
jgi:hypothetical protein